MLDHRSARHETGGAARVIKREKRAADCVQGVTAPAPVRIAPKSITSPTETIVSILINKYCDSLPLFRPERAILWRDLGIDLALTTIDDAVLRAGELLIPVVDTMKRDLLTGGYIKADETLRRRTDAGQKGELHKAYFWQYSAPGKGMVFDFEMTRGKTVAHRVLQGHSPESSARWVRGVRKRYRHQGC